MDKRPILVTGAGGFVGSHILLGLRNDCDMVGVDLVYPRGMPPFCVRADCYSPSILARVRSGEFAAVVHQAGISDTAVGPGPFLDRSNTEGPLLLADACNQGGAVFVYASSHSVYGTNLRKVPISVGDECDTALCTGPLNSYAESKLRLDRAMYERVDSLRWYGLRYTNVFGTSEVSKGPMASILSQVIDQAVRLGRISLFSDTLTAERDYIPVATVVRTIARLVGGDSRSGVYDLGTGVATSFAQLVERCAAYLGNDHSLELVLRPNLVSSRYQYYTCANMSRTQSSFGPAAITTLAEMDEAIQELLSVATSAQPSRNAIVGSI